VQRRRYNQQFDDARMIIETERVYRSVLCGVAANKMKERALPRVRVGFVGCGGIALRHLGVLEGFADVEVVAAADNDLACATDFASRAGALAFATHEEMLESCDLDALWICVPPFAHGAPERAALERGLPFFVEKPISLDEDLAKEIDDAVRRSGLIAAVGYQWRYLDTVDEARGLLADNPAHLMTGFWIDETPPPAWWGRYERSGGQVVEQATHVIDLARFLAGDIVEVCAMTSRRDRPAFPGLDVATASAATLRFASGAVATLSASCILRWGHRTALHVFSDGLAIELSDHEIIVDVGRGRPTRIAEGDPVWREDRAFIDAVSGGENRIRTPYSEAVQTHLVALAVERSARLGRPLKMEGLRADPQPTFCPAARQSAHVA
jgi:predicted dehydrogenase